MAKTDTAEKPEAAAEEPVDDRPAPRNVIEALARVTEDIGGIRKMTAEERRRRGIGGGDSEGVKYAYRGIDQIAQAAQPLFGKYGVVIIPRITDVEQTPIQVNSKPWSDLTMEVEWTIYGPGGMDDKVVAVTTGQGRDGADKGHNKANTGAFKNLLLRILCIGDPEDDTDGHTHEGDDVSQQGQQTKPRVTEVDPANDPVMGLFRRVKDLAGTPLADEVKLFAETAGKALTPKAFNDDREWLATLAAYIDERQKPADTEAVDPTMPLNENSPAFDPGMEPTPAPEPAKPKNRTAKEIAADKAAEGKTDG